MSRVADVALAGEVVGELREEGGEFVFEYSSQWCSRENPEPVSLTLPVRAEPYRDSILHPFFLNLLPEGWLLDLSTATLKLSKDDAFGLLLATAEDCIGRVEILPRDDSR